MFNLITNITCYNILICVFVGSRNEDAKRSHARRVINNPPSMLPVTANNEEPVEIEIFGTVPRPLLSNAREVTGDVEESMEEDSALESDDDGNDDDGNDGNDGNGSSSNKRALYSMALPTIFLTLEGALPLKMLRLFEAKGIRSC